MKRFLLCWILFLSFLGATAQKITYAQSPNQQLQFTENKGQWHSDIRFRADIPGGKVFLLKDCFQFFLYSSQDMANIHHPAIKEKVIVHGHAFKEEFEGANPDVQLTSSDSLSYYENYFLGNHPKHWASHVGQFRQVKYSGLYQNIDLALYSNGSPQMIYDFIVHPGGNISDIKINYDGVTGLQIINNELVIKTSVGNVVEPAPFAYQDVNGERKQVTCVFQLKKTHVSFAFPHGFDDKYPLVIDPNIVFSTYTGATADNWGYTATYDAQGEVYIAGLVNSEPDPYGYGNSSYLPTTGAFQTVWGGGNDTTGIQWPCDIGVSKFSADGSSLIYRTYIGGSNNETPNSLIVDPDNNLIIYGVSYSTNFPVTPGAYQANNNGDADIVVVKLNASGSALLGSTYVGGTMADGINYDPTEENPGNLKRNYGDQNRGEVNIDASGNIYVASCTMSADFPVSFNAPQKTFGGVQDGCAFKLSSDFSTLTWSTYIGGSSADACYSLDLANDGTLYVAGGTMSNNFPTTSGTLHSSYLGGNYDGFITRINAGGTQFLQSTFIGTAGDDQVYAIKLDDSSNVYFVGQTNGNYPVQNAKFSNANSGQFISKVNPTLNSVYYSTIFGNGSGKPNISPTAFLVDTCENVYVAGWGAAATSIFVTYFSPVYENDMYNMPLSTDALQSTTDGTDFYFFVLEKNAQSMLYGSYFGGDGYIDHVDGGTSRFDKRGIMYEAICGGCGGNSITPTTPGAWSRTNDSWNCNEMGLKIAFNLATTNVAVQAYPRATGCVPLTVQFQAALSNVQTVKWFFGDGDSVNNIANPVHTYMDTGSYRVTLVGYNPNSCNERDTAYISVYVRNDSLFTDFLPNTVVNCDSNKVILVSHNFSTTKYFWNFGDGTTSTTDSVAHYYTQSGTYLVTLILVDSTKCNLVDTFSTPITIPPTISAYFAIPETRGCIPYTVDLSAGYWPHAVYNWTFGDGTSADSFAVKHTYFIADTFNIKLIITDSASCNFSDTASAQVVTIDSVANAAFLFTRAFYSCDSLMVTLWSNYRGEDKEIWDFGDGSQIIDSDTVTHWYRTSGIFTVTHIIMDAKMVCRPVDTDQIAFSLSPLDISISVSDSNGCIPLTVNFTGNSGLLSTIYTWNFGSGNVVTGDTVLHLYSNTGIYYVYITATDSNACIGSDSATAVVSPRNDSAYAAFKLNILQDCDSILLFNSDNESTNALHYQWYFGDGSGSANFNVSHTYHQIGNYTVILVASDSNRCHPVDTVSQNISLLPNATVDFGFNDTCAGNAIQFVNFGKPTARYTWFFGDNQISGQYSPVHLYSTFGTYPVQLFIYDTSTCNIEDSAEHTLNVFQTPLAGFNVSDTLTFDSAITFMGNSLYYDNIIWSFGDTSSPVSDESNPIHTFEVIGETRVCVTAMNSKCSDTSCKEIFIRFIPLVGVPNAFSPNGDGVNDVVKVEGKGIVEMTFIIYNRWGQKVFESHDINQGWDGTFNGVMQEVDAYAYTLQATLINKQIVSKKGNITLLR